jgi:hypothetical protein
MVDLASFNTNKTYVDQKCLKIEIEIQTEN